MQFTREAHITNLILFFLQRRKWRGKDGKYKADIAVFGGDQREAFVDRAADFGSQSYTRRYFLLFFHIIPV